MHDKQSHKHLSTTALARAIEKDSKELFILLANSGWIVKVDNHWQLTEKGRFEGGTYANHPKYGEYIVWPESLDRKSTRLNSSHVRISYAVFCLKKKNTTQTNQCK